MSEREQKSGEGPGVGPKAQGAWEQAKEACALGPTVFESDKPPVEENEIVRYSKRDLDAAVEAAIRSLPPPEGAAGPPAGELRERAYAIAGKYFGTKGDLRRQLAEEIIAAQPAPQGHPKPAGEQYTHHKVACTYWTRNVCNCQPRPICGTCKPDGDVFCSWPAEHDGPCSWENGLSVSAARPDSRGMTNEQKENAKMLFDGYFADNYPGPRTIISDPHWHGPKIFNAVISCLREAGVLLAQPANGDSAGQESGNNPVCAQKRPDNVPLRAALMGAEEHLRKCCACNYGRTPCSEYKEHYGKENQ